MIVVVKSGPETTDGRRGVAFAREAKAVLVLLQNAVAFAQAGIPAGGATTYVLEEDLRLRGIETADLEGRALLLGYPQLIDLLAGGDKVVGAF